MEIPETYSEFLLMKEQYLKEQSSPKSKRKRRAKSKPSSKHELAKGGPQNKRPFFSKKVASQHLNCDWCHVEIAPGQSYLRDINKTDSNVYCHQKCSDNHASQCTAQVFSGDSIELLNQTLGQELRQIILKWKASQQDNITCLTMPTETYTKLLRLSREIK